MEDPNFYLEGIVKDKNDMQDFEGPLSLILMLLSKNKIEIRDIKIADILDQYLEYLDKMQSMDLEIASEFVQMASHLLYIKTKTLLASDEQEVSELELLMASLEQLKAKDVLAGLKEILPAMKTASETGLLYYTKLPEPLPRLKKEYEYRHYPVELLKAMYSIYSRGGKTAADESLSPAIPSRIIYSVKTKSRQLLELLRTGSMELSDIYKGCRSRSEVVATFVSVLELCSMGSVHIDRTENSYMLSFVGGDVENIIEKIVE